MKDFWPYSYAVKAFSDSFGRLFNHIQKGHIISIGGARFSDILVASSDIRLHDTGIIVLQCGNNVANKSDFIQEVELQVMKELIEQWITHLNNRPQILISAL